MLAQWLLSDIYRVCVGSLLPDDDWQSSRSIGLALNRCPIEVATQDVVGQRVKM